MLEHRECLVHTVGDESLELLVDTGPAGSAPGRMIDADGTDRVRETELAELESKVVVGERSTRDDGGELERGIDVA